MGDIAVTLPSGAVVLVSSAEPADGGDLGFRDHIPLTGFFASVGELCDQLVAGFGNVGLEQVEATLGVEVALGKDGLIPRLVPMSASAQMSLTIRWKPEQRDE